MKINTIYNESCLDSLRKMKDESVDCIVTSPPYNKSYWSKNQNMNNGFKTKSRNITYGDFEDNMKPEKYIEEQKIIITECLRVLKENGSMFYNHIDILNNHTTIHPSYIYEFPLKQIIVWNRKNTPKLDASYFYPVTEYIFWLKKQKNSKPLFYRKNAQFKTNVWEFQADTKNEHPAPFPITLAANCIISTTNEGDLVYDPYMGSGTTAVASVMYNRNFIGSELHQPYINMANKRLESYFKQTKLL